MHGVIAKQIAHVYNQIATDGEDSLGSYFAKGSVQTGAFAFALQTHYSQYDSQHDGANTATLVHTIAGPTVSIPWFVADDRTFELHAAACTRILRMYAGIGYVEAQSSYNYPLGYGRLRGLGAGLERFAEVRKRFDGFGSLYYYPDATGPYGTGSVTFALLSFDAGVRARINKQSGLGIVFGLYEEMRTLRPGNRSGFMIRDGPYVGVDL